MHSARSRYRPHQRQGVCPIWLRTATLASENCGPLRFGPQTDAGQTAFMPPRVALHGVLPRMLTLTPGLQVLGPCYSSVVVGVCLLSTPGVPATEPSSARVFPFLNSVCDPQFIQSPSHQLVVE